MQYTTLISAFAVALTTGIPVPIEAVNSLGLATAKVANVLALDPPLDSVSKQSTMAKRTDANIEVVEGEDYALTDEQEAALTALAAKNPDVTETRFLKERRHDADINGEVVEGEHIALIDEQEAVLTALAAENPAITEVRFLKTRGYDTDANGEDAEGEDVGFIDEKEITSALGNSDLTKVRYL